MIRRSLIKSVFRCRDETVLNFNYHPTSRAGIGQIICPKCNVQAVTEAMRKKCFVRLPENYNPLELSPRNNILGERRKKALTRHREDTLRNWVRCEKNPTEEAVAQLFEKLIVKAIVVLESEDTREKEADSSDEDKIGTQSGKVTRYKAGYEGGNKENMSPKASTPSNVATKGGKNL